MKNNIKTRPKRRKKLANMTRRELQKHIEALEDHDKDFERELRLLLAFYEGAPWGTCEYQEDIVKKLKKALGDS